jgi:hypothetical protein
MDQPVWSTSKGPRQKVFQVTILEAVKSSDSDVYENVEIS